VSDQQDCPHCPEFLSCQEVTRCYSHRFLVYCHTLGKTPTECLRYDCALYPGGKMTGFIIWGHQQIAAYLAEHPESFTGDRLLDQTKYDAWLDERYDFHEEVNDEHGPTCC